MPSELPPDFNPPPTEFDPADEARLKKVIQDTPEVELYRHKIEVEQRFEEVVPANLLAEGYQWFVLGLAYSLIKIDRSVIEAYRDALGKSIKVLTHQAPRPLVEVNGSASWPANPWSGIIQGIPDEHAMPFIDYLSSFVFKRADTGHDWICDFREVTMSDPFFMVDRPVNCWLVLPRNVTLHRKLTLVSPGIMGHPPMVGMVREARDG